MSRVITYANNNFQCFCQIQLDNGERILISIANIPTPNVKIMKLGFFGLLPIQTIWKYNPTIAGSYDAYVLKMMKMFQDPLAVELKNPLDILRDRFLSCKSISEVQDSLLKTERNISK